MRRAREAEATELRAKSARYDSVTRRMDIDPTNGLGFQVPIALLDEFAGESSLPADSLNGYRAPIRARGFKLEFKPPDLRGALTLKPSRLDYQHAFGKVVHEVPDLVHAAINQ
jgi:hypothetical protein